MVKTEKYPKIEDIKITNQMLYAQTMMMEYRDLYKNAVVHSRRFHYFLVTRKDDGIFIPGNSVRGSKKMIDGKEIIFPGYTAKFIPRWNCKCRLYRNNKSDYNTLDNLLVRCRLAKLIPYEWIIDKKSSPFHANYGRIELFEEPMPYFNQTGRIPWFSMEEMPDFDKLPEGLEMEAELIEPVFDNQDYHMVVVIEKNSYTEVLQALCAKYGADLIQYAGQPTITRTREVAIRAQERGKPVLVIYMYDMDPGGWVMGNAMMARLNQMYPHSGHKLIKALLTREQIEKYDLPLSFDVSIKGYDQAMKDRFIEETGSSDCVELDALDPNQVEEIIEEILKEYANLEEDEIVWNDTQEKWKKIEEEALKKYDITSFEENYEKIKEKHNTLITEIEEFIKDKKDSISEIEDERDTIFDEMKESIKETMKQIQEEVENE